MEGAVPSDERESDYNNAKKRKPVVNVNAFGVMMKASKKMKQEEWANPEICNDEPFMPQDESVDGKRNAFDVLMKASQEVDAFCPFTVKELANFVMKKPALRQFIGALIEAERSKEEKQKEKERAQCFPYGGFLHKSKPEEPAVVQAQMEELRKKSNEGKKDDSKLQEHNIDRHLAFVTELRKKGCVRAADGIPPPPTEPSPGAPLVALSVHFSTDSTHDGYHPIVGFTMIYADQVEISTGPLERTKAVHMKLDPGEHIECVTTMRCRHCPTMDLHSIEFETTKERCPSVKLKDRPDARSQWVCWEVVLGKRTDPGTVLRSIGFQVDQQRQDIICLKTVAIQDLTEHNSVNEEGIIPSLETLAHAKLENHFKAKAQVLYRQHIEGLSSMKKSNENWIYCMYARYEMLLRRSPEAEMVRQLDGLYKHAVSQLRRRRRLLSREADEERNMTEAGNRYWIERIETKNQEQACLYRDHLSFHDTYAALSGEDCSAQSLCTFPECRTFYFPGKLPIHKRCIVEGCTSVVENCGCGVKACPTCHKAICLWHSEAHFGACDKSASKKCGVARKGGFF
jgi:hypothetical protein